MNIEGSKVLVTGMYGFLGKHLVPKLESLGAEVIKYDYCDIDLREQYNVEALLEEEPNYIIHLAGHNGGIEYNRLKPAEIFYDNTLMTLHLLRNAANYNCVKKVLSMTTSCSYPDNGQGVLSEDMFFAGPPNPSVACHAYAKRNLAFFSDMMHKQYGLNAVTACGNNVYGPGDCLDLQKTKVVMAMIRKFEDARLANQPEVVCWGTGEPLREFIYVDDICRLIINALKNYEDHSVPLNLTSGQEISIKDLSELVADLVGYTGSIVWDTTKNNGQMRKRLSTDRMFDILGAQIFTPLEEGLKKTIEWYRSTK